MLNFKMVLFGICIKFDLHIHRTPNNADKCNKEENAEKHEETPIYDDSQVDYLFDESKIAKIANQFQEDLKKSQIYDIPNYSDVPPRYGIQEDVEIITDNFERELEDIVEGRR